MIKILLDTNFLVLPFELKVDIFSEFERIIDEPFKVYTLSTCLGEVKKVKPRLAVPVEKLLLLKNVEILKGTEKDVDKDILKRENYFTATNDKLLKKGLKEQGKRVIFLRQRKFLQII